MNSSKEPPDIPALVRICHTAACVLLGNARLTYPMASLSFLYPCIKAILKAKTDKGGKKTSREIIETLLPVDLMLQLCIQGKLDKGQDAIISKNLIQAYPCWESMNHEELKVH